MTSWPLDHRFLEEEEKRNRSLFKNLVGLPMRTLGSALYSDFKRGGFGLQNLGELQRVTLVDTLIKQVLSGQDTHTGIMARNTITEEIMGANNKETRRKMTERPAHSIWRKWGNALEKLQVEVSVEQSIGITKGEKLIIDLGISKGTRASLRKKGFKSITELCRRKKGRWELKGIKPIRAELQGKGRDGLGPAAYKEIKEKVKANSQGIIPRKIQRKINRSLTGEAFQYLEERSHGTGTEIRLITGKENNNWAAAIRLRGEEGKEEWIWHKTTGLNNEGRATAQALEKAIRRIEDRAKIRVTTNTERAEEQWERAKKISNKKLNKSTNRIAMRELQNHALGRGIEIQWRVKLTKADSTAEHMLGAALESKQENMLKDNYRSWFLIYKGVAIEENVCKTLHRLEEQTREDLWRQSSQSIFKEEDIDWGLSMKMFEKPHRGDLQEKGQKLWRKIQMNIAPVNVFLKRIHTPGVESKKCVFCDKRDTLKHALLRCKEGRRERQQLRTNCEKLLLDKLGITGIPPWYLSQKELNMRDAKEARDTWTSRPLDGIRGFIPKRLFQEVMKRKPKVIFKSYTETTKEIQKAIKSYALKVMVRKTAKSKERGT